MKTITLFVALMAAATFAYADHCGTKEAHTDAHHGTTMEGGHDAHKTEAHN